MFLDIKSVDRVRLFLKISHAFFVILNIIISLIGILSTKLIQISQREGNQMGRFRISPARRKAIYITTLLSNCSFSGLLGAYAMVKDGLSQEAQLDKSFLGFIDGLSFFGRMVGFVYLIYRPSATPKRDYLRSSIATAIFLGMIPLSVFLTQGLAQFVLSISMFMSGCCRIFIIAPYLIVSQHYDAAGQDKAIINFWYSVQGMGDAFTIILTSFMLVGLDCSWQVSFLINLFFYVFLALVMSAVADEVPMSDEVVGSDRGTIEGIVRVTQVEMRGTVQLSAGEEVTQNKQHESLVILRNFIARDHGNGYWVLEYTLLSTYYYCMMIWFPLYFMELGLYSHVFLVTTMYSFCTPLGTLLYQNLSEKYQMNRSKIGFWMMFTNVLAHFLIILIPDSGGNVLMYMGLVACDGILQGGSFVSVSSWQLSLRTQNNKEKYLVMLAVRLFYQLAICCAMISIGLLMQIYLKYFLYFLLGLTILNTCVCYIRHEWYPICSEKAIYEKMEEK